MKADATVNRSLRQSIYHQLGNMFDLSTLSSSARTKTPFLFDNNTEINKNISREEQDNLIMLYDNVTDHNSNTYGQETTGYQNLSFCEQPMDLYVILCGRYICFNTHILT